MARASGPVRRPGLGPRGNLDRAPKSVDISKEPCSASERLVAGGSVRRAAIGARCHTSWHK